MLAEARGQAAQIIEQAEAYRAQTVNDALGAASRFTAVLAEYQKATDVTRRRIYLETIERVLSNVGKIILDPSVAGANGGGTGVVPFLPLNDLMRSSESSAAAPAAATGQGN